MSGPSHTRAEQMVIAAALSGRGVTGKELDGAEIRGALIRDLLTNVHGPLHWRGVLLRNVHVVGDIDLSYCTWHGALRLLHCSIDGDLDLRYADAVGAIVLNGSRLGRIDARNCQLHGSLRFIGGFAARGGLRGTGMVLSGVLNLDRTTLVASPDWPNRTAVSLYRARLDDLYMTRSVLVGGFYGNGMTVQRNVRLSGMNARSRRELGLSTGADTQAGYAVSLAGATVGGTIYLFSESLKTDPPLLDGGLDLTRVSCGTLQTRAADIADTRLAVDHLSYDRFRGIEPREWLATLERLPDLAAQPYRRLAQVCDDNGRFTEARDARIALQRRIDREAPGTRFNRLRRSLLRLTVAYGYRAGWAVGWLLLVSLLAVAVLAVSNGFMVHEQSQGPPTRGFDSVADAASFTLDSLLPFARLGVTDAWSADPQNLLEVVTLSVFVTLKGLAWALGALALAATTGLVRRD